MSVQFGRWNFDGKPLLQDYVDKVSATLGPYGPDSNEMYSKDGVYILYRAFHTTKESRREAQPFISLSGAVITWDGRLDNRTELISELHGSLLSNSTDVEIAAAAFERWGEKSFAKLIGDWALSVWNRHNRTLILAKDPIGTRHLYYSADHEKITWSTILDPLVCFADNTFDLDEEYIAGLFAWYPAAHLTPFVGIKSVPPSSSVILRPGRHMVGKYWAFDPDKRIRYGSDAEYEEHFRTVFTRAVERKLRSDSPVLAELSGGRDSSSIVCIADAVIARGHAECPRLDTISYYDDSEPNWNERPYFTKVEEMRGRTGSHFNVGARSQDEKAESDPPPRSPNNRLVGAATPGTDGRTSLQLRECLVSQGNRVLLCGIGGDEVMGGVPTPLPELEDLLARAQMRMLAHQLKLWALQQRKPWFHLFFEALRDFLPLRLVGTPKHKRPVPWLCSDFVRRHWAALRGYPSRTKLRGGLPSFQGNVGTLEALQRQLSHIPLPFDPHYEKRYPYLERELLDFMFAIPREQLVRPTQRRSLMRRALVGIVPDEILNRKNKAFVARAPLVGVSRDWAKLMEATQHMATSSLGIVDPRRLSEALLKARRGEEVPMIHLSRTMWIDGWLKVLRKCGVVNLDPAGKRDRTWEPATQG